MPRLSVFLTLFLALAGSPAGAEDSNFDVPGGEVRTIYSADFSPNTSIECRLRLSETNPNQQWSPSFSIILSETEDVMTMSDELRITQLRLGIDPDSGRRTYSLIVYLGADSNRYAFLGTGDQVTEISVSLGFRDDGVFGFRATEDGDTFGQGYELEPRVEPKYAVVVASGLAGTADCGVGGL